MPRPRKNRQDESAIGIVSVNDATLATSTRSISDLHAMPKNPRKAWSGKRAEQFHASIIRFGDLSGIVFNRRTGHLIGGHKRIEAFKQFKATIEIEKHLDPPDRTGTVALGWVSVDGARWSYREVEWDSAREKAANLAANRWSAAWDYEAVSEILNEIGTADQALTGFDEHEITALISLSTSQEIPSSESVESDEGPTAADNVVSNRQIGFTSHEWKIVSDAFVMEKANSKKPLRIGAMIASACQRMLSDS